MMMITIRMMVRMTMMMMMMMIVMIMIMIVMIQVGPRDGYVLTVGGFNAALSTLGDSMTRGYGLNGMKFTTK